VTAKAPPVEGPPPTGVEVAVAIERWLAADVARKAAADAETAARVVLVDVLHRAGLRGFSL
jgi:NADH dehydrogenase FAD-containing subunit